METFSCYTFCILLFPETFGDHLRRYFGEFLGCLQCNAHFVVTQQFEHVTILSKKKEIRRHTSWNSTDVTRICYFNSKEVLICSNYLKCSTITITCAQLLHNIEICISKNTSVQLILRLNLYFIY